MKRLVRLGFAERTSTEIQMLYLAFSLPMVVRRICAWLGLIVLVGCGTEQPQPTFPAVGIVKWRDGQAATELAQSTITLSGKGSEGPAIPANPRGQVQPDGSFVLQTFEPGDGAPAGKYLVSVTYSYPSRLKDSPTQSLPLDPRFQSCQTSGLEVTIKPEKNELLLTIDRAKH
jgi:hypothetical protein